MNDQHRRTRFKYYAASPTLQSFGGTSSTVGTSIPIQALREYGLVDSKDNPVNPNVDVFVDKEREKLVVEMPVYPQSEETVDWSGSEEQVLAND